MQRIKFSGYKSYLIQSTNVSLVLGKFWPPYNKKCTNISGSSHSIGIVYKKTTVIICNFFISLFSSKLPFALKINQFHGIIIKLVFYAKWKLLFLFPISAQKSWQSGTYQEQQCSFRLGYSNLKWTFTNKSQVSLHK